AQQRPLPPIIVSGDTRVRERLTAVCRAHAIEALPDIRIASGREALTARLRALRRSAQSDVVLRDEALEAAARAMSAEAKADVVLLDVTGGATSVIHARPDGVVLGVHERLGVGAAADRVVARAGLDRVRRWIPRAVEAPLLLERVYNRARWPDAIPASVLALTLEMALAREAIAHALADAEHAGASLDAAFEAPLLVLTGRLAQLPRAAQSLLVAIDVFGATGPTLVSRAPGDALVAAGALAARGRVALLPTIDALAIVAEMWPRRSATVKISDANGVMQERVGRGSFLLVPTRGRVEIVMPGLKVRPRAEDLELGVVIDARGRPLALPPRDAERIPTLSRWHAALKVLPAEVR
ncbi:MAG TPA: glutamate mutase L, partial [Candidatus Limnocylindria bacterium]|nr:glutamate mutase L [Candidatus Limnocylindria bacterium]